MKTPIRTQNSIEIATAAIAVTATIAASKRDVAHVVAQVVQVDHARTPSTSGSRRAPRAG